MDFFVLALLILCQRFKSLLDYTNLFLPNDYEKNDVIIKKVFLVINIKKVRMSKINCTKCKKYKQFKKLKISYTCDNILLLSSICNKCGRED